MAILLIEESKKKNVAARSRVEDEFRGLELGLCEGLWLRQLLEYLGYSARQPIRLYYDNKVGCDIAINLIQHECTKTVEVDRFFIKEKFDKKILETPKIVSKDQLAYIFIKSI